LAAIEAAAVAKASENEQRRFERWILSGIMCIVNLMKTYQSNQERTPIIPTDPRKRVASKKGG